MYVCVYIYTHIYIYMYAYMHTVYTCIIDELTQASCQDARETGIVQRNELRKPPLTSPRQGALGIPLHFHCLC